MKKTEVKVFNAYLVSDEEEKEYLKNIGTTDKFEFHNKILKKNGTINNKFTPKEEHLETKIKYELEPDEALALSILKDNVKKMEDLYDSAKRKLSKYENSLVLKTNISEDLYRGDHWDCNFSPLGRCIYKIDDSGESVCVFCNEPEERR